MRPGLSFLGFVGSTSSQYCSVKTQVMLDGRWIFTYVKFNEVYAGYVGHNAAMGLPRGEDVAEQTAVEERAGGTRGSTQPTGPRWSVRGL